jgi:hypothetical protein
MWSKASIQGRAAKRVALHIRKKSHALAEWHCNRLIGRVKQRIAEERRRAALCTIENS